jgi:hypothetical protein
MTADKKKAGRKPAMPEVGAHYIEILFCIYCLEFDEYEPNNLIHHYEKVLGIQGKSTFERFTGYEYSKKNVGAATKKKLIEYFTKTKSSFSNFFLEFPKWELFKKYVDETYSNLFHEKIGSVAWNRGILKTKEEFNSDEWILETRKIIRTKIIRIY